MATLDDVIVARLQESVEVKKKLLSPEHVQTLREMSLAVAESLRVGGKVIFAGNGGSFADSIHLAGEFVSRGLPWSVNRCQALPWVRITPS